MTNRELGALFVNSGQQTDCRTYDENGRLISANRYSIRYWTHNAKDMKFDYIIQLYSITLC